MTRPSSCHLLDMLAEVPDPRNKKGKRHPLKSVLTLVVVGLMCGHKGYTSIATWARYQPSLTKALGFTHKIRYCCLREDTDKVGQQSYSKSSRFDKLS